MEYIKSFFGEKKLFYPTSEVRIWEELKEYYDKYGYEWINLDICKKTSRIRRADQNNRDKFLKLKGHETNLRSSIKGVKVPFIVPPPKPDNYDRYLLLKKWSKNKDCFNSTMAAVDLFKNYNLEPCKDYDPVNVLDRYYEEKRKDEINSVFTNSSSSSISLSHRNSPTAPDPPIEEEQKVFRESKSSTEI